MEKRQDLARLALQQAKQDARWRRGKRAPQRRSRPRSGPVLLQTAFSDLLCERGWVIPALNPLFTDWPGIVGPEIAAHVAVVDVDGVQFIVRADSKAWASQARLLEPQIVARLNQHLDHEAVRTLRVLSPQDPKIPAEKVPLWRRAGLVTTEPAGASNGAQQPSDEETPTPFYAPPNPPGAPSAEQAVRHLALARARADRRF
ncbi:DciA family protein [Streptomyces goshikiensis]|uniref:DciA family protein n=1 Tax=Streptomyces goshikiensis TaxID=1942 RepID=UPI0036662153